MTDRTRPGITETELLDRLAKLPRKIAPASDPWPRIEERILAMPVRSRAAMSSWISIAAGVAVAFAIGIMLGSNWEDSRLVPGDNESQVLADAEALNRDPALRATLEGTEREYQAAFTEFIMIGRNDSELSPATLENIETNWQEILEAEAALATALEQYPENSLLNRQMLELRQRQLELLKQLAGLDQTSRRNEI